LEFSSRFEESSCTIGLLEVVLRKPWKNFTVTGISDGLRTDLVELAFRVPAISNKEAIELTTPTLDLIIDDISFQMQAPLKVYELEVIDVTPPVAVGEHRESILYPVPNGYDQYKLSRSVSMVAMETVSLIRLRNSYSIFSQSAQDALDWYIKALHAQYDVDRFIFYWIAFEILYRELGEKVEEPTRLRCQHEIVACSQCGKSTSQVRQAASAQKYMATFGIDTQTAKKLWDMRQLVHGAKSFRPEKLIELATLTQILRYITLTALKYAQGKLGIDAPNVEFDAPNMAFQALGGGRSINEGDLRWP
jgi:hypothetical protein